MPATAEVTPAESFFYARLSGDATMVSLATGGFHSEYVPATAQALGIAVLWTSQGPSADTYGDPNIRIMSKLNYIVRAVMQTADYSDLQPAAEQLDSLLHNAPVMALTGGYTMRFCGRQRPYSRVERVVNVEYRHLGGVYQVIILP